MFTRKLQSSLGMILIAAMLPYGAYAQEGSGDALDNLLDMSLEDLSKVNVSVASKREENIYDAPGVVNVITSEDIRRFGGNDLRDVLNRHPSIQVYNASFQRNVSIRGQGYQMVDNHLLFLINGRPFRDSLNGEYSSSLLSGMSLDAVDRIEIIHGPGSVLYGSGAFSGVVNIVTKKAEQLKETKISAGYGSFESRVAEGTTAKAGENWSIVASGKVFRSPGWDNNLTDRTGTNGVFEMDDNAKGGLVTANYEGFSLTTFYGENKHNVLSSGALFPIELMHHKRIMADAGYEYEFLPDWSVKYNATYNSMDFWNRRHLSSEDILNEVAVQGKVIEDLHVMVGGTFENQQLWLGTNNPGTESNSRQWWGAYTQADYKPVDWLKLIAGVQLNKPGGVKRDYSPRAGAIVNFTDNFGLKLLYSNAFRSSTGVESSIFDVGIITGNPSLKPEQITTTEAQLFYHQPTYNASLTVYHSKMRDLVQRVGFPIAFTNAGETRFDGVELEGEWALGGGFNLMGNLTWQQNVNQANQDDTTYTPNIMAKGGVSYDSQEGYSLGLFNSYFGDPSQIRDFRPIVEYNPEPESYHLMTLNATVDINKVADLKDINPIELNIFVDNLLDQQMRYPDLNNGSINSVPIHSGIAVYGKISVKF